MADAGKQWERLGFEVIGTGGGCEAYSIERGNARILVTDGNAGTPRDPKAPCYIGFYDADDQVTVYFDCDSTAAAIAIFKASDWYTPAA